MKLEIIMTCVIDRKNKIWCAKSVVSPNSTETTSVENFRTRLILSNFATSVLQVPCLIRVMRPLNVWYVYLNVRIIEECDHFEHTFWVLKNHWNNNVIHVARQSTLACEKIYSTLKLIPTAFDYRKKWLNLHHHELCINVFILFTLRQI